MNRFFSLSLLVLAMFFFCSEQNAFGQGAYGPQTPPNRFRGMPSWSNGYGPGPRSYKHHYSGRMGGDYGGMPTYRPIPGGGYPTYGGGHGHYHGGGASPMYPYPPNYPGGAYGNYYGGGYPVGSYGYGRGGLIREILSRL